MRGPPLNSNQLCSALKTLAALLPPDKPAEMILIGGGAGMLSGLLPTDRSTVDLDVMDVTPPEVFDLCCHFAPRVAEECGISPSWFDSTAHTIRHTMLDGARDRTVFIGEFGPLGVRAITRIDLISLKLIAGKTAGSPRPSEPPCQSRRNRIHCDEFTETPQNRRQSRSHRECAAHARGSRRSR